MKKALKYSFKKSENEIYECIIGNLILEEEKENELSILVMTPEINHWSTFYNETMIFENKEWRFKKRSLPEEILNLEDSISLFIISHSKKI